jgi:hypothetical protein
MDQDRLSDPALLKLLDSDDDLSFLTPEEKQRMVALATVKTPPSAAISHDSTTPTWTDTAIDALPTMGGMAGSIAGGKSTPVGMALSGLGGAAGESLRQIANVARGRMESVPDTPMGQLRQIATEGAKQGGLEALGRGAVGLTKRVARATMQGAIPKAIAKEFDTVNLPQEMLDRGALPGSSRSARRISGLSQAANTERTAAAQTVPPMRWPQAAKGHIALYDDAVRAGKPDRASRVVADARKIRQELPTGLDGPGQLARKDILQQEGKAAVNAANPKTAALMPQLANAERKSIVEGLRKTPRMAKALDESQTLMAIDAIMKDASHSNPLTRLRSGGVASAMISPIGASATAHALNQGSRVVSPQALRLLSLIMGSQE